MNDFFDNQSVGVERLLQAGGEQAWGAADLGGNVGRAQGGGGQPARAVGGVQIGIGQVRARRLNRVIFVVGEFGIHLFHGGGIAQCADGGQVVVGIAAQGGVSAFGRVQAAFVAPLCRHAVVQRRLCRSSSACHAVSGLFGAKVAPKQWRPCHAGEM